MLLYILLRHSRLMFPFSCLQSYTLKHILLFHITGNVLMSFTPTLMSDVIKMGFVLSVAVSFPLVIFPCRASMFSLLFKRVNLNISCFLYHVYYMSLGVWTIVVCTTRPLTLRNFIALYNT